FPTIGTEPYQFTLGPHNFYWLSLAPRGGATQPRSKELPTLEAIGSWHGLVAERSRPALERAVAAFLPGARWFRGKADVIRQARILDEIPLRDGPNVPLLVVVLVEYCERESEIYLL